MAGKITRIIIMIIRRADGTGATGINGMSVWRMRMIKITRPAETGNAP